jgi:hypothetical protein
MPAMHDHGKADIEIADGLNRSASSVGAAINRHIRRRERKYSGGVERREARKAKHRTPSQKSACRRRSCLRGDEIVPATGISQRSSRVRPSDARKVGVAKRTM